jgi:hypothetical protein
MRMISFLALALVFAGGTHADAAAWCAYYNEGTNCGFATFEQCEADISGVGGYCAPNAEEDLRK